MNVRSFMGSSFETGVVFIHVLLLCNTALSRFRDWRGIGILKSNREMEGDLVATSRAERGIARSI
jgi:hypothetical protein